MKPPAELLADITPYQFFMLALGVWALLALAAGAMLPLDADAQRILDYMDNVVCVLFFGDFVNNFARAPRKLHYMRTWGWIDLLSSIPTVDALRWGRLARIARILRVLRGVKAARTIATFFVSRQRSESAFLSALLVCVVLVTGCSIAILQFEKPAGGNIASAEDAVWWAITTMTTVGYGDRYPVTMEGRLVAVVLMIGGVGAFATLSGLLAAWFLAPQRESAS